MNFFFIIGLDFAIFQNEGATFLKKFQTTTNYFLKKDKIFKIYMPFNIYKELVLSLFY
jgi:hypothetical protein